MTAQTALLMIQADVDPAQAAEWNRWYADKHLPDLLRVPGIRTARRFERAPGYDGNGVAGELQHYLAVYDLDSVQVLESDGFRAAHQPPTWGELDQRMLDQFRNFNRSVMECIGEWTNAGADPAQAGGLQVTALVPEPAYEEEYNAWYDEEHVPGIMPVPGVLRARRFRAVEGEPRYLALYDLSSPEVRFGAAFERAIDTPWSTRMRKHTKRALIGLFRSLPATA
jgi:hypothetical protein